MNISSSVILMLIAGAAFAGYELRDKYVQKEPVYFDGSKAPLLRMPPLKLDVVIAEPLKQFVDAEALRNRFELTLRKYGVVVDQEAGPILTLTLSGIDDGDGSIQYSNTVELTEKVAAKRIDKISDGKLFLKRVLMNADTWRQSATATVEKAELNERLLESVQKKAEAFANEYLKQNEG